MAEFRLVANAERSPTMCAACGTNKGPFIDLDVTTFSIATPTGWTPIVDGSIYLCVGIPENPGCAVQIGRGTKMLVDRTDYDQALAELGAVVDELSETRKIAKKKTISLEDAERLLAPAEA